MRGLLLLVLLPVSLLAVAPGCASDDESPATTAAAATTQGATASSAGAGTGGGGSPGAGGATGSVGATGSGGSAGGSGGSAAVGGAGGADCAGLYATFDMVFQQAVACNACMGNDSCLLGPKIHDACGCEVGASANQAQAAADSEQAYGAWTAAGCGPQPCGKRCPTGATWSCMPNMMACMGSCGPI